MPGSFRKQDAAASTAERAVQVRPPGSILKALRVRRVALAEVADLVRENHYLHSAPAAATVAYGVFLAQDLVGAAILTPGAKNAYRILAGARSRDVATLARLWLADEIPRNAESRVLGVILAAGTVLALSLSARGLRRSWNMVALESDADDTETFMPRFAELLRAHGPCAEA